MFILIALGLLALVGIVATVVAVARDGYRARATIGAPAPRPTRSPAPSTPAVQTVGVLRLG